MKTYVQSNWLRLLAVAVLLVLFSAGIFPDPISAGAIMALPFIVGETKGIDDVLDVFEEFKRMQFDPLRRQTDQIEAAMQRVNKGGPVAGTERSYLDNVELKAIARWARSGCENIANDPDLQAQFKALTVDFNPGGGFLVLPTFSSVIQQIEHDVSPIRQLAGGVSISGDAYEEPVSTGAATAVWVAEQGARAETAGPELKLLRIAAHEIYAMPSATQKLLDDSSSNVEEWVTGEVARSFAEEEGTAFVVGNGVGKPRGFLTHPTSTDDDATRAWGTIQYFPTGAAGNFIAASATTSPIDVLISALFSLKPGYRQRSSWLMNSKTAAVVRKLKDVDGRNVWTDAIATGLPPVLLGRPVSISEDMPVLAADSLSIAIGDFARGYLIVDRVGLRVLRDPFTSKPFVKFYTTRRTGGDVRDSQAFRVVKFSVS